LFTSSDVRANVYVWFECGQAPRLNKPAQILNGRHNVVSKPLLNMFNLGGLLKRKVEHSFLQPLKPPQVDTEPNGLREGPQISYLDVEPVAYEGVFAEVAATGARASLYLPSNGDIASSGSSKPVEWVGGLYFSVWIRAGLSCLPPLPPTRWLWVC
jgi:hypothetical protein